MWQGKVRKTQQKAGKIIVIIIIIIVVVNITKF